MHHFLLVVWLLLTPFLKITSLSKTTSGFERQSVQGTKCLCLNNDTVAAKAEEHLRILFRVNLARLITSLQTLAFHANEEIIYMLHRARWRIYEGIRIRFPRLLTQSAIPDSIEELIERIRKQIFINADLTPNDVQEDVLKTVKNFFVQILPSIFLCISTGPCRSVKQSYANCLQNNTSNLAEFYGHRPVELPSPLHIWVLKYRLIENTIKKLHRLVTESENITKSCTVNFGSIALCSLECSKEELGYTIGYCRKSCEETVNQCLRLDFSEWDTFISILSKLTNDFDKGFQELDKEIIRSISYAMEVQSPVIAKTMYLKCGSLKHSKVIAQKKQISYRKPEIKQRITVQLIYQFLSQKGTWGRLSKNVCVGPSESDKCWNGSEVISNAEINSGIDKTDKTSDLEVAKHKIPDVESSGSMSEWSDDEDMFSEGSGSGDENLDAESSRDYEIHNDHVKVVASSSSGTTKLTSSLTTTHIPSSGYKVSSTTGPSKNASRIAGIRILSILCLIFTFY